MSPDPSLIDRYRIVRETRDGRVLDLEVTLSDWVFNAIAGDDVLTLNRRYFQLRRPLGRRLYELARKQCGTQPEWKCGLDKLKARTDSTPRIRNFADLFGRSARLMRNTTTCWIMLSDWTRTFSW